MTINTTPNGVLSKNQSQDLGNFDEPIDAAEAFLNRWEDKEEPSSSEEKEEVVKQEATQEEDQEDTQETTEESAEETDEDTEEQSEEESDEESEEDESETEDTEEEADDKEPKKVLADDAEVEVKVDNEIKKVAVKDLKRLYGQEAALTKKSQQVAAQRKEVEAQATAYAAKLDSLYKKAATRWEPYSKIDMLLASKELDAEQFAQLRKEAQEAYEEFQFVSQEADVFMRNAEQQRMETLRTQAVEAVEVLKGEIPGWNDEVYNKIRTFAIEQGIPADSMNQIVNPAVIKIINQARLYNEGKKIVLKKKMKTPTKVIKGGTTTAQDINPDKSKVAFDRLRRSGDTEDAAEAFLSRWQ